MPGFRDPQFLLDHIRHTMAFYHPRAIDPEGGFFHFFRDDGSVYDAHTRHLVSSARFVFNYAMAYRHFGDEACLQAVEHGVAFLRDRHRDAMTGGYAWLLGGGRVIDATNHCYGLAFVLLAYSHASMAGVESAHASIGETFDLMERKFWSPASACTQTKPPRTGRPYRLIAAEREHACLRSDAGRVRRNRAGALPRSRRKTRAQRRGAPGRAGQRHDLGALPRRLVGGLGLQQGRQDQHLSALGSPARAIWPSGQALLILERHADQLAGAQWLAPRAPELFDAAMKHAWDDEHGGIVYGFAPDGSICDGEKYFWVQAESIAAAALLANRTGEEKYWQWYERIWEYSWEHFVDHEHGAWYRILTRDNRKISDEKSPAGKTDYHTMGACYEVLNVVGRVRAGLRTE